MIRLGVTRLGLDEVVAVAREGAPVELAAEARERMLASRAVVDRAVAQERVVYGVTTGFGELKDRHIPGEQVAQLQVNLLRSHCAGVGPAAPRDVVRAMLLLRAASLAHGRSGVRPEVVEMLVAMLDRQVTPVVPLQGSVGASGDLAPLAHLASVLIGEGAERFAVARGMKRENLLTEETRKVWLLWKESHSDWWGPGVSSPRWRERFKERTADEHLEYHERLQRLAEDLGIDPKVRAAAIHKILFPPTGTIHCSTLAANGDMSGCTTTSGLAWKIPGRLGDSPIIGVGCYTDQDVGSAGATGSGEENIRVAGAHTIVENMRRGMEPFDAGMDALKRIVRNYDGDMNRLQYVDMTYYILRKDGAYAGVSLWTGYEPGRPHTIAVHDGTRRLEKTVSLFEGASQEWPPVVAPSKASI